MAFARDELLDQREGRFGIFKVRQMITARKLNVLSAGDEVRRLAALVDEHDLLVTAVNHKCRYGDDRKRRANIERSVHLDHVAERRWSHAVSLDAAGPFSDPRIGRHAWCSLVQHYAFTPVLIDVVDD